MLQYLIVWYESLAKTCQDTLAFPPKPLPKDHSRDHAT